MSRGSLVRSDEERTKFSELDGDMFWNCRISNWKLLILLCLISKCKEYVTTLQHKTKINHEEQYFLFYWSCHGCFQCCFSVCPCPTCQKHPIAISTRFGLKATFLGGTYACETLERENLCKDF